MRLPLLALSASALLLSGCSANFTTAPVTTATPLGTIRGTIFGGQGAIQGAHIYVLAVGTTGYGSAGASVSLLTNVPGTTSPDTTTFPGSTIYYVTSGAAGPGGLFSITGDYTCTSGQQVYLYAVTGSPDTGVHTNSGIGMLAGLGQCPVTGTLATQVPFVTLNEISTVVTAYALAGFASDATHISSSGTTQATTGATNAMANVANLINVATGLSLNSTAATNSTGTVPAPAIDTLANILAACVNSTSNTSTNCNTLFGDATSDSTTSGAKPTDTATAAINIAHFPGANISSLFGLQAAAGAPFANNFTSAPQNYTIGVQFSGGGINGPQGLAIDGAGNIYTANNGGSSVSKISPLGVPATNSGATTGGLSGPTGIAIDTSGNVWITNATGNSLSKFSSTLVSANGSSAISTGLNSPQGVEIDYAGNVWVANKGGSSIVKYSSSGGTALTTVTDTTLVQPYSVSIDGDGNAWAPSLSGKIVEISNAGTVVSGSGYTGGGVGNTSGPRAIATDGSGNAWVANSNDVLSEFSNSGSPLSGSGITTGGIDTAAAVAIDGAGSVWVSNNGGNSVSHFTASGTAITGNPGYQANLYGAEGLAIDPSGNLWVANNTNSTVTLVLGAATPVITPIAAGLPTTVNTNGTSSLGTKP